MIQKIICGLETKNLRNIPRHKIGFYSFIVVASAVAVILPFVF